MNWYFGVACGVALIPFVVWFIMQIRLTLPPPVKSGSTDTRVIFYIEVGGKLFTKTIFSNQPFSEEIEVTPTDVLFLASAKISDRIINSQHIKDIRWNMSGLVSGPRFGLENRLPAAGWKE